MCLQTLGLKEESLQPSSVPSVACCLLASERGICPKLTAARTGPARVHGQWSQFCSMHHSVVQMVLLYFLIVACSSNLDLRDRSNWGRSLSPLEAAPWVSLWVRLNASPWGPDYSGPWSQAAWVQIPALLLTNWPHHLTSLGIGFLICKMGMVVAPSS